MNRTYEELETIASRIPLVDGVPANKWQPGWEATRSDRQQVPGAASLSGHSLSVIFADELPQTYESPDELVQGVLTADGGSMWYGASNTGKTFLVIDLAASVARGLPWMGRQTEQGLVVYIAAESPMSVQSRLQAYQQHNKCKVPDFAIVQSPLNLFSGENDTNALIRVVAQVEQERSQKARLIVGDTLARLSAGANENSGQDMGRVVARIDRIRDECKAHFLMIHHSGKNEAFGARGWSGIRAAVDTEVEITEGASGRCAEITKQRDLASKGERIGFQLEQVRLGQTKWGADAITCVVTPAEAPTKTAKDGKCLGSVERAVLEFLDSQDAGIRRADLVRHLEAEHSRSSVYGAIQSLAKAGLVHSAERSDVLFSQETFRPRKAVPDVQACPVLSNLNSEDRGNEVQFMSSPVQPPYRGWTTGQTGQPANTLSGDKCKPSADFPDDVHGEVI